MSAGIAQALLHCLAVKVEQSSQGMKHLQSQRIDFAVPGHRWYRSMSYETRHVLCRAPYPVCKSSLMIAYETVLRRIILSSSAWGSPLLFLEQGLPLAP